MTILKWIIKKYGVPLRTGFLRLGIETSGWGRGASFENWNLSDP
jgi:hypothetical protein